MVLKTCKWYQTVRLVMTRRLVPNMTFSGQIFELTYLIHYVPAMLFVMTSGDLNIDLTQKVFFLYKSCSSFNKLSKPYAVCRYDSWFSRSEGGPKGPPPDIEPFRARPE